MSKEMNVYTEMATRMALSHLFGQQYSGDRDIYEALGYDSSITTKQYFARYVRQDIAQAVIDRPVNKTWEGDVHIEEPGKDESVLQTEFKKLYDALGLKNKFKRADKLCSIAEFSVLLLGFSDVDSEGKYSTEVSGKVELKYVKPYGQGHVSIQKYDTNTYSERFGLPELYNIEVGESNSVKKTILVHHSRVVHVTGELLESDVFGVPVLQSIWNRLMDLEKLTGGSAEMYWRGARPGYQLLVDKDYVLGEEQQEALQSQIDEYEHNLRRMFNLEGVKIEGLATQVSDPKNHIDMQLQMIAAVTGIPKRILTGSERGELSSTQDQDAWYSLIQNRRNEQVENSIVRRFIDRLVKLKVLPEVPEYDVVWSELFAQSEKEKVEIGKVRATAIKEYLQTPGADMIFPIKYFLEYVLCLDDIKIETIMSEIDKMIMEDETTEEENNILETEEDES